MVPNRTASSKVASCWPGSTGFDPWGDPCKSACAVANSGWCRGTRRPGRGGVAAKERTEILGLEMAGKKGKAGLFLREFLELPR